MILETFLRLGVGSLQPTSVRLITEDRFLGVTGQMDYLQENFGQDTGWISLSYLSGFAPGTAGQLSYRVRAGVVYISGGAEGVFPSGAYTQVNDALIPAAYRPTISYRTGAMGSGMRGNCGVEIHPSGAVLLGWREGTQPAWISAGCSYPVEV